MRGVLIFVGIVVANPAIAQSTDQSTQSIAPGNTPAKGNGAEFEFSASPSFGSSVSDDIASTMIDESEYEASFRAWTALDRLNGLRAQLKAGITYSPNYFDDDQPESGVYGEAQLGDTFIRLRNIVHGNFSEAEGVNNAVRPYARYRFTSVHKNFMAAHVRDDQQATIGLRYRHVPYVMTEDNMERGLYFEARIEINRIWSTDNAEELWNPKTQVDIYSKPLWRNVRLVGRATFEGQLYDHLDARPGKQRDDWRMRLTGGFDISDIASKLFGNNDLSVEILGRFQRRWSNADDARHVRAYFVPSLSITAPL